MPMAMVVDYKHDSLFPYWTSIRRRFDPDSSFFSSGNLERELLAKQLSCTDTNIGHVSFVYIDTGIGTDISPLSSS
ncbi:hypothetical protein V6N13_053066 [Hibiscus sabdariffa]